MTRQPRTLPRWTVFVAILALAVAPATSRAGPVAWPGSAEGRSSAELVEMTVSFKLDPTLTRSLYMGDRWVSPARFSATSGTDTAVVQVRLQGVDARGVRRSAEAATWVADDPEIVAVSPVTGADVTLTILTEGETFVRVEAGRLSKVLTVKARQDRDVLRVEITQ